MLSRWRRPASPSSAAPPTPPRAACGASRRKPASCAERTHSRCQSLARLSRSAAAHRGAARHHARRDSGRRRRARRRRLPHPRGAAQFAAAVRVDRGARRDVSATRCLVGAGTVLVDRGRHARARRGRPSHRDAARRRRGDPRSEAPADWSACPGVATPTEAFAALAAGADGLKMFPAEALPPPVAQGVARGAAVRYARVSGRRHPARQHGAVLLRRERPDSAPDRISTARDAGGRGRAQAARFGEAWRAARAH